MVSPATPSGSRLVARMLQPWTSAQQVFDQLGTGGHEVLAVVEDKQHLRRSQVVVQYSSSRLTGSLRYAEAQRHDALHQRRIGQRGQLDEPDTVAVDAAQLFADTYRQTRLAYPTRTGQGQQARLVRQRANGRDLRLPTDKARQLDRQVAHRSTLPPAEHPHDSTPDRQVVVGGEDQEWHGVEPRRYGGGVAARAGSDLNAVWQAPPRPTARNRIELGEVRL
jgi:hypothetical protein